MGLISGASIYSTDAASVMGSTNESVPVVASGEVTDEKNDKPQNPIKAVLMMLGVLIGIRVLWEVAGE